MTPFQKQCCKTSCTSFFARFTVTRCYTSLHSLSVMASVLPGCILLWILALRVTRRVRHQLLMSLSCPRILGVTDMVLFVLWNITTLSTRLVENQRGIAFYSCFERLLGNSLSLTFVQYQKNFSLFQSLFFRTNYALRVHFFYQ